MVEPREMPALGANDPVLGTFGQYKFGQMRANEAGDAGNQNTLDHRDVLHFSLGVEFKERRQLDRHKQAALPTAMTDQLVTNCSKRHAFIVALIGQINRSADRQKTLVAQAFTK